MTRRMRQTKGFSLIETLVAVAIAGVVLGGFYNSLSTGGLLTSRAEAQAQKIQIASGVMDRVGIDIALRAGTRDNGRVGRYDWQLIIGEGQPADMQLGPIYPGELLFVFVSVRDPGTPEADPVVLRAVRYAEGTL